MSEIPATSPAVPAAPTQPPEPGATPPQLGAQAAQPAPGPGGMPSGAGLASGPGGGTGPGRWVAIVGAVLAAISAAALVFAWNAQQRVKTLEAELVKRQQESAIQVTEARTLARQAELSAREAAAKVALLDARLAETTTQRSQLEDLYQSLSRSRDDNVLVDVEAAIRVALQHSAITGSTEPLLLALEDADKRLARYDQPRLERVRRAVAQDLEQTRNAGATDITVLTMRLDDVIRQVDELPLLAAPVERRAAPAEPDAAAQPARQAVAAESTSTDRFERAARAFLDQLWQEVRSLVRVTRIEQPEAMLVAPEQAYFLRENLKLRLLHARLALLSRQFDAAQADLRDAHSALDRYFDRGSRRVVAASDTVRQVMGQSRLVKPPRPDATLAAIAALSAGR